MNPSTIGFPEGSAEDEQVDVRAMLSALWRGRKRIMLFALGGAILAFLVVSQFPPTYSARASVMLEQRKVQILTSDNVVSDLTLNNPLLDTQVAVMRSNILLERVIAQFPEDRLAGFDPANREKSLIARLRTGLGDGLRWVRNVTGLGPDGTFAGAPDTAALLTPQERRMRRLLVNLRRNMKVWRDGQSYVITVAVETNEPELSMLLANAIVNQYIGDQVNTLSETVRGATALLTERVDTMRRAVEDAEAAVEDYRIGQLAAGGVSAEALAQQLIELSTQIALARADLAGAEARYRQIQSVIDDDGFEAAAELLSSPFVLSLREEESRLDRADSDLATQLGAQHPDRARLRASRDLIAAELTGEVEKIVRTLRNDAAVARIRAGSLEASLAAMESRAANLSRASLDLRQLEREADAARASYEAALSRLGETRSIEALQRPDARIVERAMIPGGPSGPRILLFTALGGVSGLSVGLIAVFFMTVTSAGFRHAAQLERSAGMPVAVSLPRGGWRDPEGMLTALRTKPFHLFSERLRGLRHALSAKLDGTAGRSVLVTSSLADEGKTSAAVALAFLEAAAGRSCVLLDVDLRRSHLAGTLGYAPAEGDLGDYLAGRSSLAGVIGTSTALGFDLISSLRPHPDAAAAVNLPQMLALVEELKARYDLVVIDTPPLLLVADTLQLARGADATVLLVKQGSTRRRAVLDSVQRLKRAEAGNLFLALSMVDPRDGEAAYGMARTDA